MNEEQRSASSEVHYVSGRDIKELNKELNKEDVSIRKNEHHTYSSQIALQSYISPLTNPSRDEDLSSLERRLDEALERLVLGASTLEEAVERMREARTTMDFSQSIPTHSVEELPYNRTAVSSAVSEAIDEGANEANAQSYNREASSSSDSHPYNVVYTPSATAKPRELNVEEQQEPLSSNANSSTNLNSNSNPPAIETTTVFNEEGNDEATNESTSTLSSSTFTESSLASPLHHERESSLRESLGESHAEELLSSSSNEEANLTTAIVEAIEEGFEKVADAQGQDGNQTSSGNAPTSDALPSSGNNIETLARSVMSGNGSAVLGNAVSGGAARLLSSVATAVPAGIAGFTRGGIKGGLFAGAAATAGREAYAELAEEQAYAERFGSNFYEMRANTSALREAGALASDAQSDFERIRSAQARMSVGDFSMASEMVSGSRGAIDYSDIEQYGNNPATLLAVTAERMIEQGYSEDEIVGTAQLMGFQSLPSLTEGWSEGTREQIEQRITQAQGRDEQAEQAGSTASALVENTDAVRIAKDAMLDLATRNADLVDPINGLIESNDSVATNLDKLSNSIDSFMESTFGAVDEIIDDVTTGVEKAASRASEEYEEGKQWVESSLINPVQSALEAITPEPAASPSTSSPYNPYNTNSYNTNQDELGGYNPYSTYSPSTSNSPNVPVPPQSSNEQSETESEIRSSLEVEKPPLETSLKPSTIAIPKPSLEVIQSEGDSPALLAAIRQLDSTFASSRKRENTLVIENNTDGQAVWMLKEDGVATVGM